MSNVNVNLFFFSQDNDQDVELNDLEHPEEANDSPPEDVNFGLDGFQNPSTGDSPPIDESLELNGFQNPGTGDSPPIMVQHPGSGESPPKKKPKPKTKRALKPCKPGQERNPATNRCRKIKTPKKVQSKKVQPKKVQPKKVQPKKSTPQTVSMSDDEKQLVAERIAKRAFDVGRNPLDTAGMDTDDEEWMGENPDYGDYVEQVYQDLVDSKPKKSSPKKEKPKKPRVPTRD